MADYDRWDDERGASRRNREPERRDDGPYYRERGFSRPPRLGPTGMMSQSWTGETGASGRYYEDEAERADYGGYAGGEAGYRSRRVRRDYDRGSGPRYAGDPQYPGRDLPTRQEPELEQPYADYGRAYSGYGAGGGYTPTPQEGLGRENRSWGERPSGDARAWFAAEDARRARERSGTHADAGHRGRGPKGYIRSDERICEDISDRLTDDAIVDASDVEVLVQGGEVTLNGTVDSRTAKRRVEDCADSVMGVGHVQNNLRVRETPKPGSIGAQTDPRIAAVSEGRDEADAAKDAAR